MPVDKDAPRRHPSASVPGSVPRSPLVFRTLRRRFLKRGGSQADSETMRAALHVTLTPIVFLFGWTMLSAAWAPWPVRTVGAIAAAAAGVAYGWKNRHR